MRKIIYYYLLFFLMLAHCTFNSEVNDGGDEYYDKCWILVLEENVIDQEYIFNVVGKVIDEMSFTYLGSISTQKGGTLKVLNVTNFTGFSEDAKRASSSVYLYDGSNNEIGKYYVGGLHSLPSRVSDGNVIFLYNNEMCDRSTSINFSDSIPDKFL